MQDPEMTQTNHMVVVDTNSLENSRVDDRCVPVESRKPRELSPELDRVFRRSWNKHERAYRYLGR